MINLFFNLIRNGFGLSQNFFGMGWRGCTPKSIKLRNPGNNILAFCCTYQILKIHQRKFRFPSVNPSSGFLFPDNRKGDNQCVKLIDCRQARRWADYHDTPRTRSFVCRGQWQREIGLIKPIVGHRESERTPCEGWKPRNFQCKGREGERGKRGERCVPLLQKLMVRSGLSDYKSG